MTTPIQHGYPDWGRQSATVDIEITNFTGQVIAAQTTYPTSGTYFVGIMPYIYFYAFSATDAVQFEILWYADDAQVNSLGWDIVTIVQNGSARQCIPVRGPYMTVRASVSAYPATISMHLGMVKTPFAEPGLTGTWTTLIQREGDSVAAGATLTANAFDTRGGEIYWQGVFHGGALGLIKLYTVHFSGSTRLLDVMGPNISNQGRIVFAPAMPLRVEALNSDAAARLLYLTVLNRPFAL